jgi:transposase
LCREPSTVNERRSPVRSEYFITLDTHCRSSEGCIKTTGGKLIKREHMATTLPALIEFIRSVPHPRRVCFEEGPLAGWLYRGLCQEADELVVCDPRRNAYVGKDGDKDDPIDAEKLNDLFRSKMIRPVHQNQSIERAGFKQLVSAYHAAVGRRVCEANRLIGLGKRWGLLWNTALLLEVEAKTSLKERVKAAGAPECVQAMVGLLCGGVQQVAELEEALEQRLKKIAKGDELMKRLMEVPGYGPIRAVTLVAYLDTPWRFRSREALWKYCGIGLRRSGSGDGPEFVQVEQQCNRILRNVVIGAAQRVIQEVKENEDELNVFARRYARWIRKGISPCNARRNVARLLSTTAWAMWKSGQAFCPEWIDKTSEG